jgi:hypothetical protein
MARGAWHRDVCRNAQRRRLAQSLITYPSSKTLTPSKFDPVSTEANQALVRRYYDADEELVAIGVTHTAGDTGALEECHHRRRANIARWPGTVS